MTFDDGYATQMAADTLLLAHGMRGTYFINSALLGTPGRLTWSDTDRLASEGNEIGGHTLHHVNLTTVDGTQAREEVCDDRGRLMNRGYEVQSFAYPFGEGYRSSTVRAIVQDCGFNSARRAWGLVGPACQGCTAYAEPIPPLDVWGIMTTDSVVSTTTLDAMKRYVTDAESRGGGWVPLLFHHICDGCDEYSVSQSTLQSFLDWLQPRASVGTVVRTVREVIGGTTKGSPGTVDRTPPSSAIACNGSQCTGSYASPVQVSLAATDGSIGTGVEMIRYSTDGSVPTLSSPAYAGPFTVSSTTTVRYAAWDNAGNAEVGKSQLITIAGADTTPPSSSILCGGTACSQAAYTAPVQVSLNATDGSGGSGVASIRYTTDGSVPTLSSPAYAGPFSVSSTTTVRYAAWDNAGNAEVAKSQLITIAGADTTPPSSSILCGGTACSAGWYMAPVDVSLSATDSMPGSGVASIRYTTDGSVPTLSSPAYAAPFTVSSTTTVRYAAWDNAGNAEPARSQVLRVDVTAPSIAITSPTNGTQVRTAVKVSASAVDGGSGVARVIFYVDGIEQVQLTAEPYRFNWNAGKMSPGQHQVTAVAVDVAGNRATSAPVLVTVVR